MNPITQLVNAQLERIAGLDSSELETYIENVEKYSVGSTVKTQILEAAYAKRERYNRDGAMVETSDPEDMGGE